MNKLEKALAEAGWKVVGKQDGELTVSLVPLRKVEKQRYFLMFYQENTTPADYLINETEMYTDSQAEKVSKAIEALMEYITVDYRPTELLTSADQAREALEGTNEL